MINHSGDAILSSSSETSIANYEIRLNQNLTYSELYLKLELLVPDSRNIGQAIAELLVKMIDSNTGLTPQRTIFHSKSVPGISIQKYLERLTSYSRCSPETFILALIYIDRYTEKEISQCLMPKNVHKLYFIGLVVAAKFNDDLKLANWAFAKLGGMDKCELCLLEIQFLRAIEFNMHVSSSEFVNYFKSVIEFGN